MAGIGEEKIWKNVKGQSIPKCCIKYDADMLKNLCKAMRFDGDKISLIIRSCMIQKSMILLTHEIL